MKHGTGIKELELVNIEWQVKPSSCQAIISTENC